MTDSTKEKNSYEKGKERVKKEQAAPFSDLLKVVSYKAHLKPKTIQKVYDAIYEYIVEELQLREAVYLKGMGYFGAIPKGGYDKLMPETFGSAKMVYKYVPPYFAIRFKATEKFMESVNSPIGAKKEKAYRRGQLIEPSSDLKEKRRALVKTMLRDEGQRLYDPKNAKAESEMGFDALEYDLDEDNNTEE